ncbi:MAG: hypothetical protein OXC60_09185 [Litoreibacter sp.]|nr:hypothetical protein [Litoreibacter sp.]MCY4334833.1 hypothetical protein [Litoreibacter sp.]
MTNILPCIAALAFAGCAAPGVDVWGGASSAQVADGHSFTVNHTRKNAEAYRTNRAWRLSETEVFASAALAMEQASGCKVARDTISGDVALVKAELIC